MKSSFLLLSVVACGGGLPLAGPYGSGLAIDVTSSEDSSALAGALGYAEYSDGTTELVTADDSGHLAFVSPSVGSGVNSISVAASGRVARTIVAPDVGKWAREGIALYLYDETPQPTAILSGTVKNKAASSDVVELAPTVFTLSGEIATSGTYDFVVPRNTPFTIVGSDITSSSTTGRSVTEEIAKWFHVDVDALDGDRTLDIDVGAQAPDAVTSVSNKLIVPDPSGAFGSTCSASVEVYLMDPTRNELTPRIGAAKVVSLSSDGSSFAFDLDYVNGFSDPLVTVADLYAPDQSYSRRLLEGPPPAKSLIDGFRVPLAAPTSVSAGDVLDAAGAVDPVVFTVSTMAANPVWSVELDSGAQLPIPALPNELKAMFAAPGPYQGSLETCSTAPASDPVLGHGFCVYKTGSAPAKAFP